MDTMITLVNPETGEIFEIPESVLRKYAAEQQDETRKAVNDINQQTAEAVNAVRKETFDAVSE